MYASYTMLGCFSERVCCITRVCKFLHTCVASYMHVHASKISTRVFVSAVCVSHTCPMCVDFVLHAWDTCVTRVDHLSCG